MKLGELVVGREYAVHRYYTKDSYWSNTPAQAKLLRIDLRQNSSHRHYRVCVFELLQDGPWQVFGLSAVPDCKGAVIELEPRYVWRPWPEQAKIKINTEKAERELAINANAGLARSALGRLGLHGSRGMTPSTFATDFEVTLSVAELTKLADRADHLVELERLMLLWRANVLGDGSIAPDKQFLIGFDSKLLKWVREHDFETLLEDMRRDRELQLGASMDTPPRQL